MKNEIPNLGLGPVIQSKIKYFPQFEPHDSFGGYFTNVEILKIAEHPQVYNTFGPCARLEYMLHQKNKGLVCSTNFYFRIKK